MGIIKLLGTQGVLLLILGGRQTGGILIAPQPGAIDLKPGSATKPFYGIKPLLVDQDGKIIKGEEKEIMHGKFMAWPNEQFMEIIKDL